VIVTLPNGTSFTLTGNQAIPFGARVDARKGRVRIVASDGQGGTYDAVFFEGIFVVTQQTLATAGGGKARAAATRPKIVVDLKLVENVGLSSCPKSRARAAAAPSKKRKRHLWGDGKGQFRITGRHSSATVRGTLWMVEDRCDGTLTRVRRGLVEVRDFTNKKTVLVKAGKQYLAPARRKR
jgi:hypothetical protein